MTARKQTQRDLREECVQQALAIIAENGLDALSLRDVARRLKVSHQAPYKHFASREHILAEVLRRAYADFADYLERRIRGQSGTDAMHQLGLGYLGYAKARPLQYQLMFATPLRTPEAHPEMMSEARRAFGILCDTLAALPNHAERNVASDALFVWSTMHGLASIMKTRLGKEMGLTDAAIPGTSRYVLDMIGKALGAPSS